jgi:hypothetical protein
VERVAKFVLHSRMDSVERFGVGRMERDHVPIRDICAIAGIDASSVHRTLETALDLDGLERRVEQPRGGALEQSLEESLNRRKRAHRAAQLSRGPLANRTIATGYRYPFVMPQD